MRSLVSILVSFCLSLSLLSAQDHGYLFPEFVSGHLEFYDGSRANVRINFDALEQKVLYYDGETLMEMTNLPRLKILQADGRIFVVKEGLLCEVFNREGGPVLVNWRFRKVNKGSKGALGLATQGKVEAMRISPYDLTAVDGSSEEQLQGTYLAEIWQKENANIYFISMGGKSCKVRSARDLYRAFPDQADALKSYVRTHGLTMVKTEDAFQIIDHLRSLIGE